MGLVTDYLIYEGQFKLDEKNGFGTSFIKTFDEETGHPRSTKHLEGNYLNGNLHGGGVKLWDNGNNFSSIGAYKHGIQVGRWGDYHANGKLRCTWLAGIEDPRERHHKQNMYHNGQLVYVGQAKNSGTTWCGHGSSLFYDGRLQYSGTWLDGMIHCDNGVTFHETGHIQAIGPVDMGIKKGHTTVFTEAGKLIYVGDLENGGRDGYGKYYHHATTGQLRYDGTWKNNQFHGVDNKEYHENGNLKYQGNFHMGLKHRAGKDFDIDGQFIRDVKHHFGKVCLSNPNQIL
jgi:antitoxin component YwqK of YwqJK toxin-antitoxin module